MKRSLMCLFGLSVLTFATTVSAANPSQANIPVTVNNTKQSSKSVSNSNIIKAKYKENEIIVKYKKNVSFTQVASSMGNNANINIATTFKALSKMTGNIYTVVKSKSLTTEELLKQLQSDPNVEYAEPNYIYYQNALSNDPEKDKLWGQNNTGQIVNGDLGTGDADIDAPEAWDINTGSEDVVIAVIDSGVDYTQEDLHDNMWKNPKEIAGNNIDDDQNGYVDDIYGIDAVHNTGDPLDKTIEDGGHGTHVAGSIAAIGNNGKGVVGVSWHSKIMALKFLTVNGGGTVDDAIECLNYMIAQKNAGVNIVASNNSWGGGGNSTPLKEAIKASNDAGILFVAAAGNGGSDGVGDDNDLEMHYPASYDLPGIISVSATDQDDKLAAFSNYGMISVDLAAPGTNIYSTLPDLYIPKAGDLFFDDFENNMDKWETNGTKNTWARSEDQELLSDPRFPVPSGTWFLSDSPGENYKINTDSFAMFKTDLDLFRYKDKALYIGFGAAFALEDLDQYGNLFDHAFIEVSKDSGVNWKTLFDLGIYIIKDNNARYWYSNYNIKIPEDFKTASFRLRFRIQSDYSTESNGWLIDNVGIGMATSHYDYKDGTSMAAPQVTGAIALRASFCDEESGINIRDAIFSSVDSIDSVNGKVSTNGRLNVNNLLQKKCMKRIIMAPIYYLLN